MLDLAAAGAALLGLGFAAGRRIGLRQGERLGHAGAGLEMRARLLESGRCPTCGQEPAPRGRTAAPGG